jgi:EF-P beta-lysylation protein EpmB
MTNKVHWRQIQRTNFVRIEPLFDFLQISGDLRKKILFRSPFSLNVPHRLAEKMEKGKIDDPIFRQFVPLVEETLSSALCQADPVEDVTFLKSKKLLHKYNGRVLLVTTSACAMHCRYCFRKNFPYETEKGFEEELHYIREDQTISEVILSGGDPLSLSDETLGSLLGSLNEIEHVKRIRFHSRFPIGIPERIDDSFLRMLQQSSKQIVFIVHVNHPKEIDTEVANALKKIQKLGIPVLNQAVLLKGVNDQEEVLLSLCERLVNIGVMPYYLHALDRVEGSAHFEVSDTRAQELLTYVQEHLSGYGVPKYAREEPGKPSKTTKFL